MHLFIGTILPSRCQKIGLHNNTHVWLTGCVLPWPSDGAGEAKMADM